VRIERVMRERYGVSGSLKKIRKFGQGHFGRYAGYAQEFLYLWEGERG
jgi:N-glycosylase/DNA lyase